LEVKKIQCLLVNTILGIQKEMKKLDKKKISNIISLTPMQEGMLFHYLKAPQSTLYFEQLCLELLGKVDLSRFKKAWNIVIDTNEMLRVFFRWQKLNQPTQAILKEHPVTPFFHDISGIGDEADRLIELERITQEDRDNTFNLLEVPFRVTLIKTGVQQHLLILSNHHIIYDGWSTGIILEEFFHAYEMLADGEEVPVLPSKPPFKEFVKWLGQQDEESRQAYWQEYLEGLKTGTQIPVKRKQPNAAACETFDKKVNASPGSGFKDKLEHFIKEQQVTMAAFFFSAWGILLQRYCDIDDVVFGTTVSGRSVPIKGIEEMVGLFINTIPLRLKTGTGTNGETERVTDLLRRINQVLMHRGPYENTPLVNIIRYSGLESGEALFDSMIVVENYPLDRLLKSVNRELSINSYSISESTNYDIAVSISTAESIAVDIIYHSDVCDKETIHRLGEHFKRIIEGMLTNPLVGIHDIQMMSPSDRWQILENFNDSAREYPLKSTIPQLFEIQVERRTDCVAVVEKGERFVSYGKLNHDADKLVNLLQKKGVTDESILAITGERSCENMTAIIGILKAGGAYMPLERENPAERINYMLRDSSVKILLTGNNESLNLNVRELVESQSIEIIDLDTFFNSGIMTGSAQQFTRSPDQLAYVMYTSGTTGKPKGSMIQDRNVVRLVMNTNYLELNHQTRIIQTSAQVFDVSTFEIWGPLLNGGVLFLEKKEVILDGERLKHTLSINHINTLWLTSSLFNQLVSDTADLFSSLRYLLVGGDILSPKSINIVRHMSPALRMINGYGPTENTSFSTTFLIDKEYSHSIPIGRPIANSTAYIVDRRGKPQPLGVPGELWVGGDGVSRGYLNNPELTAEKFISHQSSLVNSKFPNDRLYKTGDLVRWLANGNIEFLGRIDLQVKIRGFRIEMGEIENQLMDHKEVKESLVMTRESANNEKYLCAYVVFRSPQPVEVLMTYLSGKLPEYLVPSYIISLEQIPLTPNGKVDRKSLPEPNVTATTPFVAPRSETEKVMAALWARVLGIAETDVGIDSNFFQLGGHSLKVTRLVGIIHKTLNVRIPFTEIFSSPTIRQLANAVGKKDENRCDPIPRTEDDAEYYSLSPSQERMYVLQQMDPAGTVYNINGILELTGKPDLEKFQSAFTGLIHRHESLRTSFHMTGSGRVQHIHDALEFSIEEIGLFGSVKDIITGFIRPFDLSQAPLLRIGLLKLEDENYLLMVDMHHIISDGTSMGIFIKEFMSLYNGESLPVPWVRYRDYTLWFSQYKHENAFNRAEGYWLKQFEDEIPILDLPYDFSRPAIQSFTGAHTGFDLDIKERAALSVMAHDTGTTMFGVLLSLFTILLSKLSGQEDIVVGTPVAGRLHPDASQVIGMFVNTLALRNFPDGNKSLEDFTRETGAGSAEAFANQEYPFEDLVENVTITRDASRNPLFDAMFAMMNLDIPAIRVPGLHLKPYSYDSLLAKFDFTFICLEKDDRLEFTVEYCTRLFRENTIHRFINYFKEIVSAAIGDRKQTIASIEIVSQEEKQRLLVDFNRTDADYPRDKTAQQLFAEQAQRHPHQVAVSEPATGSVISYGELNAKANRLARRLREQGIDTDTVAGVMVGHSQHLITGIMGILKAGGAYLPINPTTPKGRVEYMLQDSDISVLLTDSHSAGGINFAGTQVNLEDENNYSGSNANPDYNYYSGEIAYVIYTSGSTGRPKGVAVEHSQLLNLLFHMYNRYDTKVGHRDRCLSLTNMMFDVSVWEYFLTICFGAQLVMLEEEKRFDVSALGKAILDEKITLIYLPPGLLKPVHEQLQKQPQRVMLNKMLVGVEPIPDEVLQAYMQINPDMCIINGYGPTETTICCTSMNYQSHEPSGEIVPIGLPLSNTQVVLLDNGSNIVPQGIPGELCVSGDGVSRGYLNNPELTGEKFISHPYLDGKRMYRTGDLAVLLPKGNLRFMGRRDQQLKIRGYRIELGEIEDRLSKHDHIKQALVLAKSDEKSGKYLCAYIVADRKLESIEIRDLLLKDLPDYMIPSYFVQIDQIPLTANGKVDKNALPEPGTDAASAKYIAPRSDTEKKLATIWSKILEIETERVGIDTNFFQMGGHSLTASLLVAKINEAFNVNLPLVELFTKPYIRLLAQYIEEGAVKAEHIPIEKAEIKKHYPLSSAQKRLYVLQQMDRRGTVYNIPFQLALNGGIDTPRIEATFTQVIQRHESLRTSFHMVDESPVQRIHDSVDFAIEKIDSIEPIKDIIAGFIRPFDVTLSPLLRVGLIKQEAQSHILMVDMHHIICDGVSMKVLMKDFSALYRGEMLPQLTVQYKDYVVWRGQQEEAAAFLRQETYWHDQFQDETPILELPLDFPRPKVKQFTGCSLRFQLSPQQTQQLNTLAIEQGATLYMVLMAAFNVLLAKISGQETLVVGTAAAGRSHPGLEPVIGMFVNTLVLTNYPKGEKSFSQFLAEVNNRGLHAFENQDYPFEKLVESIDTARDTSRNPLFDVLFDLQPVSTGMVLLPELKVEPFVFDPGIAKFDLMLQAIEDNQQLNFIFEYDIALFEEHTIQRFSGFFKKILSAVLEDRTITLAEIEIMPDHEKERIISEFNDTRIAYPKEIPIHRLFQEEAKKQPHTPAVVFDGESLTYHELDRRSDALASYLQAKGLTSGEPVGIMLEISLEMMVAVLGVLKAGGAYLPIDPGYPRERIDYMLKDSNAAQLLSAEELVESQRADGNLEPLTDKLSSANLAYIIYTSGSTGRPKGVMVEHRSVVRLVKNTNFIDLRPDDRILQTGALEFDASTFEIWGSMLNGLTLYLTAKANILNHERLKAIIWDNRITTMWLTSPLFNQTTQADVTVFSGLRNLLVGGDVLSPAHINLTRKTFPQLRIINGYGPTENTTFSTTFTIEKEYKQNIPIGKPIANSNAYIVNKYGKFQPIGIAGELWVGGDGVSRGYMNNPVLTAEKFIRLTINTQSATLYKTGDLTRWLPGGSIEFLGRLDDQVKIRGFRIEPREIENRLLEHEHIDETVVLVKTTFGGEKFLAAYFVGHSPIPSSELRDFLSGSLPNYMVPAYIIQLESIPLTANGKVDRRSLPEPETTIQAAQLQAPRDHVEEKMTALWSQVLGIEKNSLSIDADFFQMGGHSLNAALLVSKIHKEFNVNLPLTEIFTSPTVIELSAIIKQTTQESFISIEPVEQKDYYRLSSAQKRLYVLHQIESHSTRYNIPILLELEGRVDKARLETTFKELIKRHESFRTSFHLLGDEPLQRIHHDVAFQIQYSTANEKDLHHFIQPFDLSHAPLLQVIYVETGENKCLLLIDMHHIISDGSSMIVLANDFSALYVGNDLLDLRVQYKDFSEWRNSEEQTASIQQQRSFWLKEFAGEIPVLNLFSDFARPAVQRFEGDTVTFAWDGKETQALKQLGREHDATLFMVLLGIMNVLLYKLSGQDDIVIGSPIAGRRHSDLEPVIGMFINTLALRNRLSAESSFADFLEELRSRTLETFENQDYPFEELVEAVDIHRDAGRNPLFDVFFVHQNMESSSLNQVPGLKITSRPYEPKISKFDLSMTVTEVDGKLDCSIKYCTKLFKETTIVNYVGHLKRIVSTVTGEPRRKIARIEILTDEERIQILSDFNNTKTGYPKEKVIHEIFAENVERTPDNVAVVSGTDSLTYFQLNQKANQLGRLLRKKGIMPGSISAIMATPSVGMLTGILAVMKAGGTYLPIDSEFPKKRRDYMLADTGASIILTQTPFMETLKDSGELINIEDNSIYRGESTNLTMACTPGDILYTIFTSGTSGKPKGVLVKNENMVNYVSWFSKKTGLTGRDKAMLISSFAYDLGYTAIYTSLSAGGELHLMAKETYLDQEMLLDYIKEHKVTYLKLTPSLFSVIIASPQFSKENLASLRLVVLGGEAINTMDVEHAFRTCDHLQIMNHYGPTETTIGSVACYIDFDQIEAYHQKPTIGKPIDNTKIFILDGHLNPVPVGAAAELCIGGDGVSRGYLNQPELTMEKFVLLTINTQHLTLYRTGDLARWLPDGNIEFLGRIDQQVKIRGYRIELGEIETQLITHNQIKEAVVIIREDKQDGQPYICGYFVSDHPLQVTSLKEYLANSLPDYMVPSYLVQLDRIPTTPNGKLDKKALPVPETGASDDYVAPRDKTERKLTGIWAEVLALEAETISIDENFFRLGGHSLKAMVMVSSIHKELNVKVPVTRIFQSPTIRSLAEFIKGAGEYKFISLVKAEVRDHYPLTSAQRRLYILQQMSPETTGYNMPIIMTLAGKLDKDKLEETFRQLIKRHESLRTAFEIVDSQPVQKIHENVDFEIDYYDLHCKGIADPVLDKAIHEFVRPFDLSQYPILRAGLINIGEQMHILAVDMHHINSDGVSNRILLNDFMSLYSDEPLPELKLQYKDFSQWMNSAQQRESITQQEAYWQNRFAGEIPILDLPVDYVRPVVQGFEGAALNFELDEKETLALKSLAYDEGCTLYMILLSLYMILLSKLTNQEDIVVGTPVAGRSHADLENIIGVFINTLALRGFPEMNKTFQYFLTEVKELILDGFANQDYPYENLMDVLSVKRDTSRNPLFDTMFVMHNIDISQLKIPGMTLNRYPYDSRISKFDLSFYCKEVGDKLACSLEFNTELFKLETIERYANYFKVIVLDIQNNKNSILAEVEMMPEEEKHMLLYNFNHTAVNYPRDKTLHRLFEEQVERTPDRIALTGSSILSNKEEPLQLTYMELNEKSNQLARELTHRGVMPDSLVALLTFRFIDMMTAIWGILKAGAAYIPLDPTYPLERIRYILKDSSANVIVTTENFEDFTHQGYEVVELGDNRMYKGEDHNLETPVTSLHPAYAIYTSGSTGKPKGVMIQHRPVSNFIKGITDIIDFKTVDTILSLTTISFDIFGLETILPLLKGSGVIIGNIAEQMDAGETARTIVKKGVSILQVTPSRLLMLVSHEAAAASLRDLEYLLVGGEAFPEQLLEKTRELGVSKIYNMYGPTETTIWSAVRNVSAGEDLNIGKPIANTFIYILGKDNCIQPIGVSGELCISGDGLSLGYVNRPLLTAEKFVQLALERQQVTLYKTGDLARWLPDGNIEFMGRLDFQVKVRGFRIELGEIENRLMLHEEIEEAVVLAKQTDSGEYQLYAYFVSGREIAIPEIREFLAAELPDYMIPSHFARIDEIPLTPNGKIDRKTLGTYDTEVGTGVEYVAPRNSFEEQISEIWKEELNVNKIGIHDNFFELGGNSMHIVKLSNRLKDLFGENISVMTLFRYPTIHKLSQFLDQEKMETSFSDERIEESVQMMEESMFMFMGDQDE
jgi:tyrocidine synthetase III